MFENNKKCILLGLIVLLFLSIPLAATANHFLDKGQEIINNLVKENNYPGMVFYVSDPIVGEVEISQGKASLETGEPIASNMRFRIASISKTFTAASILLLEEKGSLDINDSIDKYLPELDLPDSEKITIKMLLNHSSGLKDYNNESNGYIGNTLEKDPVRYFSPEELIELSKILGRNFPPGSKFKYCDTGYLLLGMLVEKISGERFADFVEQNFLIPFELKDTYVVKAFENNSEKIKGNAVRGYYKTGNELIDLTELNQSFEFGCGNIISTARDLTKWARVLYSGKVLDETRTGEMMRVIETGDPNHPLYGLGCYYNPGLGYGHNGGTFGYLSLMRYDPVNDTSIVGFTNVISEDYLSITNDLYDAAFKLKKLVGLEKINKKIDAVKAKYDIPGIIAVIYEEGKKPIIISRGVSNIETGELMKPELRFRIASITKTFTANIILQFVDEGKISLNDHLDKFFPKVPNSEKITITQLLNHSSGVHDFMEDPSVIDYANNPFARTSSEEIINMTEEFLPDFEPGLKFSYSNVGYIILGEIIRQISGKSIRREIEERIISPLGLDDTFYPTETKIPGEYCHGYNNHLKTGKLIDVTQLDPITPGAAGAMISNLPDLAKWIKTFAEGTLLSDKTYQFMMADRVEISGLAEYGLGFINIGGFMGHNGGILGFGTDAYYLAEKNMAIIVMVNKCNEKDVLVTEITLEIFKALCPECLERKK